MVVGHAHGMQPEIRDDRCELRRYMQTTALVSLQLSYSVL